MNPNHFPRPAAPPHMPHNEMPDAFHNNEGAGRQWNDADRHFFYRTNHINWRHQVAKMQNEFISAAAAASADLTALRKLNYLKFTVLTELEQQLRRGACDLHIFKILESIDEVSKALVERMRSRYAE